MSDQSLFAGNPSKSELRNRVAKDMGKGAGVAAIIFFGGWIWLAVAVWIGRYALPEDAQTADDPAPQAYLDMAAAAREADAAAEAARMGLTEADPAAAPAEEAAAPAGEAEAAPAEDPAAAAPASE